ncbi:hypothetical protein ACQPZJ_23095 [Actinoplanes sp. CA-054009]
MPAPATLDEPLAGGTINDDLLHLLLEIGEEISQRERPATRSDTVLQKHGITVGPGWLIDMLALVSAVDVVVGWDPCYPISNEATASRLRRSQRGSLDSPSSCRALIVARLPC